MPKLINLSGGRFGRLVVISYARDQKWHCVCDCGAHTVVLGQSLRRGMTKSCGCGMGWRRIDLRGRTFGRWRVLSYAGRYRWSCVCSCGTRRVVDGSNLRRGQSKSCSCRQRELTKARATTHGMTKAREYISWQHMKARCFDPQHHAYDNYGGRGITVYERWANSFEEFFADTGTRPAGCSLDRIDNDGNYEPGNVRWATAKQQIQNQRRPRAAVLKRRQVEPLPPPLDLPPF
jgi:hypothetical protein